MCLGFLRVVSGTWESCNIALGTNINKRTAWTEVTRKRASGFKAVKA